MTSKTKHIRIEEYNYELPDEKIARFPLQRRDESKLLLYKEQSISEKRFKELPDLLPSGSLIVFNNTKVIQARLIFRKETGARIEIFCLEPAVPHDYALIFQQTHTCSWICLVGNLKKWKTGSLACEFTIDDKTVCLQAIRKASYGDSHLIEFSWDCPEYTFADLLDAAGILPIPPYLNREAEEQDLETYQTVYSKIKGSVAAPTAGLHFTPEVLSELDAKGFVREEGTLHVGAGTFKPVKSETIEDHEMHTEFISVNRETLIRIREHLGQIIAVGTTSVRTLESLYYIGASLVKQPHASMDDMAVKQWAPYEAADPSISPAEALNEIISYLERTGSEKLTTSTRIIIAPGYEFKIVKGIVTNFHQPKSTLLLLISAFVKGDWKKIYNYALSHEFRFLSYGDSSLLLP